MKNIAQYISIACILFTVASCDKEVSQNELKQNITSGTWHVSYFSQAGNVNYSLSDYDFTFTADGKITAHKDGTNINGSYTIAEVDGETILDISLGHINPLDQISNDWEVNTSTSTRLETENNDNGTSYLNFDKN